MKQSIATIFASENRGSLRENAKSRNLWSFADGLKLSVFLLASSATANTASMAAIRDVDSALDVQREQSLIENALASRHNELSYKREGNKFEVTLR